MLTFILKKKKGCSFEWLGKEECMQGVGEEKTILRICCIKIYFQKILYTQWYLQRYYFPQISSSKMQSYRRERERERGRERERIGQWRNCVCRDGRGKIILHSVTEPFPACLLMPVRHLTVKKKNPGPKRGLSGNSACWWPEFNPRSHGWKTNSCGCYLKLWACSYCSNTMPACCYGLYLIVMSSSSDTIRSSKHFY